MEVSTEIMGAHNKLQEAMDKNWGKLKQQPPFESFAVLSFLEHLNTREKVLELGKGIRSTKVVKKIPVRDGFELITETERMSVSETFNDEGKWEKTERLEVEQDKMIAVKEHGSWKLTQPPEEIKQLDEGVASKRALLDDYRAAIQEVSDGKYKTRQQVARVMVRAYSRRVPWLGIRQESPPPSAGEAIVRIREKNLEVGVYVGDFLQDGTEPWFGDIQRLGPYLKKLNDASERPLAILLVPDSGVPLDKVHAAVEAIFDAGSERIELQMEKEARAKLEKTFEGRLRLLSGEPRELTDLSDPAVSTGSSP
jgi:hypothetical protein